VKSGRHKRIHILECPNEFVDGIRPAWIKVGIQMIPGPGLLQPVIRSSIERKEMQPEVFL